MFLRYRCKCGSESWMLDYDHDEKLTKATCLKCGHTAIIEELFGKKRRVKNGRKSSSRESTRPEEGVLGEMEGKESTEETTEAGTKGDQESS